jgi:hypothetical protein
VAKNNAVTTARPQKNQKTRPFSKGSQAKSPETKKLLSIFNENLEADLLRAEQAAVEEFCKRNLRTSILKALKPILNDYSEYYSQSDYGFTLRHETKRRAGSLPRPRDARGRSLCWQVVAYGSVDHGSFIPNRTCPSDDLHSIENWEGNWAADPKSALRDFVKTTFTAICESLISEALDRRSHRDLVRQQYED